MPNGKTAPEKEETKIPSEQPEKKLPPPPAPPKLREIIIHTDGNSAQIVKAEVSGSLELRAILISLVELLNKK